MLELDGLGFHQGSRRIKFVEAPFRKPQFFQDTPCAIGVDTPLHKDFRENLTS